MRMSGSEMIMTHFELYGHASYISFGYSTPKASREEGKLRRDLLVT